MPRVCGGFGDKVDGGTLSRSTRNGLGLLLVGNPKSTEPQDIQGLLP